MSQDTKELSPLDIVRLLNSGVLLWEQVGDLLQDLLERSDTATMAEVEAAAEQAGADLEKLRANLAGTAGPIL